MQLLELFAGTRCVWKIAEKFWYKVISLDIDPVHECEITMDILDFDPGSFPEICPDKIWASIDCTTFSFASGWFYRDKAGNAKNEKAIIGDRILEKTLELLEHYLLKNSSIKYYIENPRGNMAKQKSLIDFLARTNGIAHLITYCSYWFDYRKPTNIFTNDLSWKPKDRCWYKTKNWAGNECNHLSVPRWSNLWICGIGRAWDKNRSLIPRNLIIDILKCEDMLIETSRIGDSIK